MESFFNEEEDIGDDTTEEENENEEDGNYQPLIRPKKKEKIRKRTRRQLKCKYSLECNNNLHLIDMAMNPKVQLPMDLSVFGELDLDAAAAWRLGKSRWKRKKLPVHQKLHCQLQYH
jgi:hypothetical protein